MTGLSTTVLGKRSRTLEDDEAEDDDDFMKEIKQEKVRSEGDFRPLTLVSEWIEPKTMTKRLTVCINLPSGVESSDFSVRILEGGESLQLSLTWPQPLLNVDTLHRKWSSLRKNDPEYMSAYHPEMLGFESALKGLREKSTDAVQSVTRISLPFPVETHIVSQNALAWRDNSMRAVYIRLRAIVEDYAVCNNSAEFEVI